MAGCCRPLTRPCMVKQTAHSHSRPATVDGHGSRVVWDHGCLHALRGLPPDTTCATARKHTLCTAPDTCLTQVLGEGTRLHPWRESRQNFPVRAKRPATARGHRRMCTTSVMFAHIVTTFHHESIVILLPVLTQDADPTGVKRQSPWPSRSSWPMIEALSIIYAYGPESPTKRALPLRCWSRIEDPPSNGHTWIALRACGALSRAQ